MNEAVFWALIAMLNWNATGNDEAVIAPVVEELSQKSIEEIEQFDDILASKLYALDTKAHATEIGEDAYREGGVFLGGLVSLRSMRSRRKRERSLYYGAGRPDYFS